MMGMKASLIRPSRAWIRMAEAGITAHSGESEVNSP